jgi:hypothetical protein
MIAWATQQIEMKKNRPEPEKNQPSLGIFSNKTRPRSEPGGNQKAG